ncbi:MAG: DUF4406 domain-containing protein [Candidatus Peribacteraceae bacterium]|nr:DUF4406 domain-containing protein [Candidatus Peribacteraceae bacterium]
MGMKIAYVVGPLRNESSKKQRHNIKEAREVALKLWKAGFAVICPHLNSGKFDGLVDDKQLLAGSRLIMQQCELVVTFGDWGCSNGSVDELALAGAIGIPIYHDAREAIHDHLNRI